MKTLIKTLLLFSIFFKFNQILEAQGTVKISGNIKGLGDGRKIYLGNRPNGIGSGFVDIIYDSTVSRNDSFEFNLISFKYVTDYSLMVDKLSSWVSFLIDTGEITISGNIDTFYRSRVYGSENQALYRKFYKDLYIPWDTKYFSLMRSLPSEVGIDSNRYMAISDSMKNQTIDYRKKVISFYIENVKLKPYAAFRALRMATLEVMPDSLLRKYFNMLPKSVQKSPPHEDVNYRLNGFKENITVGHKVPSFSFMTPELKKIGLESIAGKYKLLAFWASWCAPCLAEIPLLDSINLKYKKEGLKILCINVDNSQTVWKNNVSKYTFDCEHLYQGSYTQSLIYKYFNIKTIPFLVLLNEENKIIKYNMAIEDIHKFIK